MILSSKIEGLREGPLDFLRAGMGRLAPSLPSLAIHEPDPEQNDGAPQHRPEAHRLPDEPRGNGHREERLEIEKRADTRGRKAPERVEPERVGNAGADDPEEEQSRPRGA